MISIHTFNYPHAALQAVAAINPRRLAGFAVLLTLGTIHSNSTFAADIDFAKQVQPILEQNCLACHKTDNMEGGLDLTTIATALVGGDSGDALVPGKPDDSLLYTSITLEKDDGSLMPPEDSGGPLPGSSIQVIKRWIEEGAQWPETTTLEPKEKKVGPKVTFDDMRLVEKIHALIEQTAKAEDAAANAAYTAKIPQTGAEYTMLPIPGGTFTMGSPDSEPHRNENEAPSGLSRSHRSGWASAKSRGTSTNRT